jgi:hypothetical protein
MPTVMSIPDYADTNQKAKALRPATDASMITQMKRRAAIVGDLTSHGRNGRKGTGVVVDGPLTRGFGSTSIRSTYLTRGAGLTFLRVL